MSAPQTIPNVVESGRVLATLDDWRAILFGLMFIIVVLVIERFTAAAGMRKERQVMADDRAAERKEMAEERKTMWAVAKEFSTAAERIGETHDKLVIELQVLRAVSARTETVADAKGS